MPLSCVDGLQLGGGVLLGWCLLVDMLPFLIGWLCYWHITDYAFALLCWVLLRDVYTPATEMLIYYIDL